MDAEQFDVIVKKMDLINTNLVSIIKSFKTLSTDVELSKTYLRKLSKQDNSTTVYNDVSNKK